MFLHESWPILCLVLPPIGLIPIGVTILHLWFNLATAINTHNLHTKMHFQLAILLLPKLQFCIQCTSIPFITTQLCQFGQNLEVLNTHITTVILKVKINIMYTFYQILVQLFPSINT